uniref:Secreted protein n=1 Tax=Caenorhabditis japonica TaxID=281687 RepID=A0A2Q4R9X5_CAEJA
MQFWTLFFMLVLIFGAAFGADVEGSGSGDKLEEPVVLKAENLLESSGDGSGLNQEQEQEASGEDVQTFFFF